jgi:quinol monooxygenase YgiN
MSMQDVVVIARARAQAGRESDMERALAETAEISRREAGCVVYNVLRGDGGLFMTYERWRTRADFDHHMTTPHVQSLLQTLGPMLATPPEIEAVVEV